jgi:hypothetical protein
MRTKHAVLFPVSHNFFWPLPTTEIVLKNTSVYPSHLQRRAPNTIDSRMEATLMRALELQIRPHHSPCSRLQQYQVA